MDYETRRDVIADYAWGKWTKNGLGMDRDELIQTDKTVQDTVANEYFDGISDLEWLAATLKRLGHKDNS